MITRKRFNVALYVDCLSYCNQSVERVINFAEEWQFTDGVLRMNGKIRGMDEYWCPFFVAIDCDVG